MVKCVLEILLKFQAYILQETSQHINFLEDILRNLLKEKGDKIIELFLAISVIITDKTSLISV